MTLGLILSPVSGSMTRSYADEVSIEEINKEDIVGLINAYIEDFDYTKKSRVYDFAGKDAQDNISEVMAKAKEIVEKTNPSADELEACVKAIDKANEILVEKSKLNVEEINKLLKTNIINLESLLNNHNEKAGDKKYREGLNLLVKAKDQLKSENFAKAKAEDLISLDLSLNEFFESYRKDLEDSENYKPSEEQIKKLDEEIKKSEEVSEAKKYENLNADIKALVASNKEFKESDKYILASDSLKKAYNDAYEELYKYNGKSIDKDTYDAISKVVKNIADAKYKIDNEAHDYKGIETGPSAEEIKEKTVKTLKNLSAYVKGSKATLDGLTDSDLKNKYKAAIAKAGAYTRNHANGIEKELKDYQELEDTLKDLTEKINKAKGVKDEDNKKIDKIRELKAAVVKANEFKNKPAYKDADKGLKDKLDKAIKDAVALVEKEEKNPGSVTDKELEDAKKAVDNALADFNKFADKDSAKKALIALLNETKGINIDQFYGKDQKEARDAYTKAREAAAKAVKNIDKTSLEDLNKIHKDFKENIDKLAEFLNKRLKDLVDDDDNFRKTDEYKEADKDTNREESIVNYIGLLTEAQEELNKAVPDANRLNILYNKLANARSEITKKISPEKRKLSDAVLDSYVFLNSKEYQKALTGSDKYLKYAAEKYRADLERAKKLLESSKINKDEAKEVLESLNKAKDFIESKIKEKEYLIYEYTKKLNEIKNHKDYKNLNQAIRKRLEDALALAGKGGDKDEIFRALDEVMGDASIKEFIKKIEAEKNPNITRDKLLTDLTNLINEDKKLKEGGFKYQKAQKTLRDAYDVALKEATDFIRDNKNPSEDEVRAVYQKLLNAKNALDGDKFDELIHALAARFKKEQLKIANPADRKAIADKINALSGENMTMDDALRVEKELDALINPQVATTTTLTPQGGVVTNTRPVSTVTNPGSTVKTGINGIAKVAAVLVVAAIILIFTRKKGDKNETNK